MRAQSHPTFCDPMDYSPPGSSVHGISQARILGWVSISSSMQRLTVSLESLALAARFLAWDDHVRIQRRVKLILAGGLRKLPGGTLY